MGVALRTAAYRRGWLATRRLNRPVVSVGNLSLGGTGKTPFVAFLAELMMRRGWKPSVLTRGYGRRKGPDLVAIEPGSGRHPDPREVGDEPALLARKLPEVPIIVCADRYRAGLLAEEKFGVDVHIIDDGFQHLALAREVDIVLLDVTQELSDRALLPVGRLREPCAALGRAHFLALTRCELAEPQPTEHRAREVNSQARIFHCITKLRGLTDVQSGVVQPLETLLGQPIQAFCGIGNPGAFFADLAKWGLSVVAKTSFADHYVYQTGELNRLMASARKLGAGALVATEKDALKLPPFGKMPIPIYACVIQTEMRETSEFDEALFERLESARVNA